MVKQLILGLMFLSGCTSSGYTVEKSGSGQETRYECKRVDRFSFADKTMRICATAQECNEYCAKLDSCAAAR